MLDLLCPDESQQYDGEEKNGKFTRGIFSKADDRALFVFIDVNEVLS